MTDSNNTWSFGKQVGFRFVFSYFIIYAFFDFIAYIFFDFGLEGLIKSLSEFIIPLVGKFVFGIEEELNMAPTGSGDTTANYISLFVTLIEAIVITIFWTLLDRKRSNYNQLEAFFFVYLRLYIGLSMLGYGFHKVFPLQFSPPSLHGLDKSFGDFSPMGVLWRFMGSSAPYTIFSGLAEVIGGLLLLHRKTLRLGVLVVIGVMTNVVMLNFCYDVPVKLFSSHLLLMTMVLFWSDLKRYANFFILNRAITVKPILPYFTKSLWNKALLVVKVLFIAWTLYTLISDSYSAYAKRGDRYNIPLYGLYKVKEFNVQAKQDTAADCLKADAVRWNQLLIYSDKWLALYYKDNIKDFSEYNLDTVAQTLNFASRDSSQLFSFNYEQPAPDSLILHGVVNQDTLEIRMHQFPRDSFLLIKRGFRWINERPFNR